jgi:alpha,alpha-trehalase
LLLLLVLVHTMYKEQYKDCLEYIDTYWDTVTHKPQKKVINKHIVQIPNPYISPTAKWVGKFGFMFYWDTFFIFRGLMGTKREWLMKEMVNNFIYLFKTYGIIPNFTAQVSMGRSQPPFLSSMILDTYNGYYYTYLRKNKAERWLFRLNTQKKWLKEAVKIAKAEYETIWLDPEKLYNHSVNGYVLNRYGDRDVGYAHSSELESGWDFTSRFFNRCNEFLPIDLNVLLFKYERDFAKIASHLGQKDEEEKWKKIANTRKAEINKLMWNDETGFFYDFGYVFEKQSDFLSLAGFVPLWAGLATPEQAKRMVKMLPKFENDYGLTITAKESLAKAIDLSKIQKRYHPAIMDIIQPKQWDYPNIWPPLEYLTTIGLLKYGFVDEASRLMKKYLSSHASFFRKYGTFAEKLHGETGEKADTFHYESQAGFGWTNAAFYRYVHILDILEKGEDIYTDPKAGEGPYKLSVIH